MKNGKKNRNFLIASLSNIFVCGVLYFLKLLTAGRNVVIAGVHGAGFALVGDG